MASSYFFYIIISETLHIDLNQGINNEFELLNNGLAFVVEAGIEDAASVEEISALKIQKLLNTIKNIIRHFQFLSKESLFKCCYENDYEFKGYMSYINS